MPSAIDPLKVIAEILGEPAAKMRNPANMEYLCPFLAGTCIKRSQRIEGPYPVCTVFHGRRANSIPKAMCVCPKRLYQIDLQKDVLEHCWPGAPPKNPQVAYEVKMAGFGNVDFVIADVADDGNTIREFVSVEMQAVDIVGTVEPAYQAILNSVPSVAANYGINWGNVRKRYITQLITKGFYHHHWQSRIVAVLQTATYDAIRQFIRFDELDPNAGGNTIIFMLYDYVKDSTSGEYNLELKNVVGTSHNSLMMASMYRQIPDRQVFCERIISRMT